MTTKMVRLLDVKMCQFCRFHDIVTIKDGNGNVRALDSCARLDCDNFVAIPNPQPQDRVAEVIE